MKKSLFTALFALFVLGINAQTYPPKNTPQLEFALQLRVTLGEAFGINNTQHGRRTVIPITGGTFEGPGIKGTIINGGADYQLNGADGRTELEAIYCIKTDDELIIARTLMASLLSTSRQLHSLRLLPTANMVG